MHFELHNSLYELPKLSTQLIQDLHISSNYETTKALWQTSLNKAKYFIFFAKILAFKEIFIYKAAKYSQRAYKLPRRAELLTMTTHKYLFTTHTYVRYV